MNNVEKQKIDHYVWLDLEMTGLDSKKDHILEIATYITTPSLQEVAVGPDIVIKQSPEILSIMSNDVYQMHEKSGLLNKVINSTVTPTEAFDTTMSFIRQYCTAQKTVLCGNSIWQDRTFLQEYMPTMLEFFHYRMIDVSTIKILMHSWYPTSPLLPFKKQKAHRALDDIRESIAELQYYRSHFFVSH